MRCGRLNPLAAPCWAALPLTPRLATWPCLCEWTPGTLLLTPPSCVAATSSLCPSSSKRSPSCPPRTRPACRPCSMCCVPPRPQLWSCTKRLWPTSTKVVLAHRARVETGGWGDRPGVGSWPEWPIWACYLVRVGELGFGKGALVSWLWDFLSLSVFIWEMDTSAMLHSGQMSEGSHSSYGPSREQMMLSDWQPYL